MTEPGSTPRPPTGRGLVYAAAALVLLGLALYGLEQTIQFSATSEARLRSDQGSAVVKGAAIGALILVMGALVLRGQARDPRAAYLGSAIAVAVLALTIPAVQAVRAVRATSPDSLTAREMSRFEPPAGLYRPVTDEDPAERSVERIWRVDRPIAEVCADLAVAMARWGGRDGSPEPVADGIGDCEYRTMHGERLGIAWAGHAGATPRYVVVNLTIQPCERLRRPDGTTYWRDTRCGELSR